MIWILIIGLQNHLSHSLTLPLQNLLSLNQPKSSLHSIAIREKKTRVAVTHTCCCAQPLISPSFSLRVWIGGTMSLRPNARTEVRRNRYKVAVDADEGRRRREDNMVEIRKNKREENLQKKRREGLQPQQFQPAVTVPQLDKKVMT